MSVLTIYNCGTAFDRNSNDIIAELARNTAGVEGRDWIINAGAGSPGAARIAADQATGLGMYDATADSLAAISRLRPSKVNMAGWSRGSVTSLMIAQTMRPPTTCNMFLFDPVVGDPLLNSAIHSGADINAVGAHVNALAVVQQMDATDFIFQAHDPFDGSANRAGQTSVYQLPGSHGAAVYRSGARHASAYQIGRALVYDFLLDNGTRVAGYERWNSRQYLEHYSNLWLSVSNGFAYVPGEGVWSNRDEATRLGNGMLVRVVFNHHHISMLNAHAPKTALALMYVLSIKRQPHAAVLTAAEQEIATFNTGMPKTREYLQRTRTWLHMYNP